MAAFRTRKGAQEFKNDPESLRGRFFPCTWKDEGIVLNLPSSVDRNEAISLLISLGFGKGTLSRNTPDFEERDQEGLEGATAQKPFAVPRRLRLQCPSGGTENEPSSIRVTAESISPEPFQFSFEEALYLVEELSALSIASPTEEAPQTAESLRSQMTKAQSQFEMRYFVYKHYRIKGWVVKLGTKVGVDLLLYPLGGPLQAHAHYGVSILSQENPSTDLWKAPWTVPSRVLEGVAKNLLVVLVKTSEFLDSALQEPRFTLKELVLARWQSTSASKAESS